MVGAPSREPYGDPLLGSALLGLVADWDSWICRRVDTFHFAGDDERVLRRHQSVDLRLPTALEELDPDLVKELGGYPVPLTFATKWQLPEFSLCDRAETAMSLVHRNGAVRLGVSMLSALGELTMSEVSKLGCGINPDRTMPSSLRTELQEIASADPMAGLRLCVEFQQRDNGGRREQRWRSHLAADETFMSLVYELAVSFPLIALIPPSTPQTSSHLLQFSYNSYVIPAERDRLSARFVHGWRWLRRWHRDGVDPTEWKRTSSLRRYGHTPPDDSETGRLVLSSSCTRGVTRLRQRSPSIAAGIATISGEDGRQVVRLRPSGVISIAGLPCGTYTIAVKGVSGFRIEPDRLTFEVSPGKTTRLHVHSVREGFGQPRMLAPPLIASPAWLPKQAWRGCGWGSKPLAIRVRLGSGGEYRCEFKAPPGLHVTRARLISNFAANEEDIAGSNLDDEGKRFVHTVLESKQESYLECAGQRLPSAAYVLLNLRPRRETVVRPALFTALLTLVIVAGLAIGWSGSNGFGNHSQSGGIAGFLGRLLGSGEGTNDPPWGLLAVLLGGPSALAAYFAQAIPSRVTNAMLYGIRLTALLPVVLALATAAILLLAPSGDTDTYLFLVTALAVLVAAGLAFTYFFAEHPPEQGVSRQGLDFAANHLERNSIASGSGEEGREAIHVGRTPEMIRDRMLERIGGMTGATRRAALGQRWFLRWEREVPPALYFDSAETPAVFQGFRNKKRDDR